MTKNVWLMVAASALGGLLAVGCGSSSSGGKDAGVPLSEVAWGYPQHKFVLDQLSLPLTSAQATDTGFDLDGDGQVDNQLGTILATLSSAMGGSSPQVAVDDAMAEGSIIVLFDIFAQTMDESPESNFWAFLGQGQTLTTGPQPGGTFQLDLVNGPRNAYFGGRIKGGGGSFGGGTAELLLNLPLSPTSNLALSLKSVRVEFDSSADGTKLESGRLGGAVTESDLTTTIIPAVAALLDDQLAANCTARQGGGLPDGGTGCGCPSGSGTETIQGMFDTDLDCRVTSAEVSGNSIIKALLKGDVTLADGVTKALSLGVGFHAVNAVFPDQVKP